MKTTIIMAAIATATVVTSLVSQVASAQSQVVMKNIGLSSGFSPNPLVVKGTGGGSVAATSLAGKSDTSTGPCAGYADAEPNHKLVLNSGFKSLSVEVDSAADTGLVIKGPGGTWCNDDMNGKNPGVSGQWLPGTYELWVTTYNKSRAPYLLKMTETR